MRRHKWRVGDLVALIWCRRRPPPLKVEEAQLLCIVDKVEDGRITLTNPYSSEYSFRPKQPITFYPSIYECFYNNIWLVVPISKKISDKIIRAHNETCATRRNELRSRTNSKCIDCGNGFRSLRSSHVLCETCAKTRTRKAQSKRQKERWRNSRDLRDKAREYARRRRLDRFNENFERSFRKEIKDESGDD